MGSTYSALFQGSFITLSGHGLNVETDSYPEIRSDITRLMLWLWTQHPKTHGQMN